MSIANAGRPYKGAAMEGVIASWYAKNTVKSLAEFQSLAKRVAREVRMDAQVLDLAPGPGYFAIALAGLGGYRVSGLDISRSFVRIAARNALAAGVAVDFRLGDAAAMPFEDDSFDQIVCRAAFKNFANPVGALCEMHRVLRPGGRALIIDMRNDASDAAIAQDVGAMGLGPVDAMFTRAVLRSLKRRAYSKKSMVEMFAATPFGQGDIIQDGIGFEARLVKSEV
jgi:ubiquinone/menaquinone biosynthesis C-methylase UbiE